RSWPCSEPSSSNPVPRSLRAWDRRAVSSLSSMPTSTTARPTGPAILRSVSSTSWPARASSAPWPPALPTTARSRATSRTPGASVRRCARTCRRRPWAHAGMYSGPREVGALMDRYPTLWADLSIRNADVAPGGGLDPEWRALLVRHADRFLVGTDTWTTSRWDALADSIAQVRVYLSQLPPDVAGKIAFRNAQHLFPERN